MCHSNVVYGSPAVPDPKNLAEFGQDSFRTVAVYIKKPPYARSPIAASIPATSTTSSWRAGTSALPMSLSGSVRAQRTTGMMGEVVGMAAAIAHKHNTSPRGVYQYHLSELKDFMTRGVGKTALTPPPKSSVPEGYKLIWHDEFDAESF